MRTVNLVEKHTKSETPIYISANANTPVKAMDDLSGNQFTAKEYCGRYIFNAGVSNLYYVFGNENPDNVNNFHGWMVPGQMLDCSNHGSSVYVFSTGAVIAVVTMLRRNDMVPHINVRPNTAPTV